MPRICEKCHTESPNEARFCFNPTCREALEPLPNTTPMALSTMTARAIPTWAKVVFPVGVVALLGGGYAILHKGKPKAVAVTTTIAAPPPTTTPVPTTTLASTTTLDPRGTPLPRSGIATAVASSTLPDSGELSYGIERTLDAADNTAWNSAGSTGGADPVGQTLTYSFNAPQHLVGLRIWNGFERPTPDRVFTDNYRVKGLIVRAGGKESTYELADATVPQFIQLDLTNVDKVQLEITSVYPTTKWNDVAISDVQFFVG